MRITSEIYTYRVGRAPTPEELTACCAEGGWSKRQHLPRAIVGPEDAEIAYVTAHAPIYIARTSDQREKPVCVGQMRACRALEEVRNIVDAVVAKQNGAVGFCAELAIALELMRTGLSTRVETTMEALDCRILFKERMAEEGISKRDLARRLKVTNKSIDRVFRKRADRLKTSTMFLVADALDLKINVRLLPTTKRLEELAHGTKA